MTATPGTYFRLVCGGTSEDCPGTFVYPDTEDTVLAEDPKVLRQWAAEQDWLFYADEDYCKWCVLALARAKHTFAATPGEDPICCVCHRWAVDPIHGSTIAAGQFEIPLD